MKFFGINPIEDMEDLYTENDKTLLKERPTWRDAPC